jgi:hypothetical protein
MLPKNGVNKTKKLRRVSPLANYTDLWAHYATDRPTARAHCATQIGCEYGLIMPQIGQQHEPTVPHRSAVSMDSLAILTADLCGTVNPCSQPICGTVNPCSQPVCGTVDPCCCPPGLWCRAEARGYVCVQRRILADPVGTGGSVCRCEECGLVTTSSWWARRCQHVWRITSAASGALLWFEGLHHQHPSCSSELNETKKWSSSFHGLQYWHTTPASLSSVMR